MKRLLTIISAAMIAISLVGCGNNVKNESDGSKSNPSKSEASEKQKNTEKTEKNESGLLKDYNGLVKIGDYKNIVEVDKSTLEVTDEEITNILNSYLESFSYNYVEHIEGVVEEGQTINVSVQTDVEGVEIYPYENNITIGEDLIAPGVDKELIGKETGDTATVDVTYPDDFYDPAVAGKSGTITVTINYINGDAKYTEVNDEFIKEFTGNNYDNVDEFKKYFKEEQEKARLYNYGYEAFNKLVTGAEIVGDISKYVEEENKSSMEFYDNYKKEMNLSDEEFYKQFSYKDESDYKAQINASSENTVVQKIVTLMLGDEFGISVTDEDVKAYKDEIMSYGVTEEDLIVSYTDEDIVLSLIMNKVIPELSSAQVE